MANFAVINFAINAAGAVRGAAQAINAINSVGASADKATKQVGLFDKQVQTMFATTTRFFTALAVTKAFSTVIGGISDFVSMGIEYNKTIEEARIGIAALTLANGTFQEQETGRQLQGMEAFAAATAVAEDTLEKLQVANLKTGASLEDLVKGYQQALGPGLAKGLQADQIVKLTTDITNAALVMKVPFKEIGQELRAILSGQININARIGSNLQLKKEELELWVQQGRLFDELQKKLAPFAQAGQKVADTFTGALSNLRDQLARVAGEMFEPLMKQIVLAAQMFGKAFTGATGKTTGLDNIMALVKSISDWIGKQIVGSTESFVNWLKRADDWLSKNRQTIDQIRILWKSIITNIGEMVGAMNRGNESAKVMLDLFKVLARLIAGIHDGLSFVLALMKALFATTVQLVLTLANPAVLSGFGPGAKAFAQATKDYKEAEAVLLKGPGETRLDKLNRDLEVLELRLSGVAQQARDTAKALSFEDVGPLPSGDWMRHFQQQAPRAPLPWEQPGFRSPSTPKFVPNPTATTTDEDQLKKIVRLEEQIADARRKAGLEADARMGKQTERVMALEKAIDKQLRDLGLMTKEEERLAEARRDANGLLLEQSRLQAQLARQQAYHLELQEKIDAAADPVKRLELQLKQMGVDQDILQLREKIATVMNDQKIAQREIYTATYKELEALEQANNLIRKRYELARAGEATRPDLSLLLQPTEAQRQVQAAAGTAGFAKQETERQEKEAYEIRKSLYNQLLEYRKDQEEQFQKEMIRPLADSFATALEVGLAEGWAAGKESLGQGILKLFKQQLTKGISDSLSNVFNQALGRGGQQQGGGGLLGMFGSLFKTPPFQPVRPDAPAAGMPAASGGWIKDIWGKLLGSSEKMSGQQIPSISTNSAIQTVTQRSMDQSLLGIGGHVLQMVGLLGAMGGPQSTKSILLGGAMAGLGTFLSLGGAGHIGKALGLSGGLKLPTSFAPQYGGESLFPKVDFGEVVSGIGAQAINVAVQMPGAIADPRTRDQVVSAFGRELDKASRNT